MGNLCYDSIHILKYDETLWNIAQITYIISTCVSGKSRVMFLLFCLCPSYMVAPVLLFAVGYLLLFLQQVRSREQAQQLLHELTEAHAELAKRP
jgi:hypothetical protein